MKNRTAWPPNEIGLARGHLTKESVSTSWEVIKESVAEVLWPTRCVICDTPGLLVCQHCALHLPYLDQLKACPLCGAPFGIQQCCECNSYTLQWKGLATFPLDGCASACMLTAQSRRIVTVFKDRGELRMAHFMACLMAACIPHSWLTGKDTPVLVPIPARKAAVRRRGYDHLSLLVNELQTITALPHLNALEASDRHDQRSLDAKERLQNMKDSFAVRITPVPKRVILIDDVFTTGATLFAAAEALRNAGTREVYGLTFIRA